MISRFEKNFTEKGYLMNYEKPGNHFTLKNQVLQFKIELQEITPIIWRRILVPADYNFWDLHVAIQDSMGWQDYHLHEFILINPLTGKKTRIGIPSEEFLDEEILPG